MCASKSSDDQPKKIPVFNPRIDAKEVYSKTDKRIEKKIHLGWKWSRLRKAYLQQHPWCERCGLFGEEVHHIIPRHMSPERVYDWQNLMTLCKFCHMKEHKQGEWKDEKI
jgi:5-methylcytosine-specific restriction endonuclease McrA